MGVITVKAADESLDTVNDFIHETLEPLNLEMKELMQIDLCVEEIFVNIAHYAYAPETGEAEVECSVKNNPKRIVISLKDGGKPFNPLEKDEPDVTLSAEERNIGGLGIFLTKKYMDKLSYEYSEGKNILTMERNI